uniref:Putative secreted salivary protein n=1 Tax=Ixodes ricinus TaxID=34613 RepID=A0A147BVU5_IXORI
MLPFSKMPLAVFAVVLILPALQSGGLLSGTEFHKDCMELLEECGEKKCHLEGSDGLFDYDPKSCRLECLGQARPKVPDGVCAGDLINCTSSTRECLRCLCAFVFFLFFFSFRKCS